MFVELYNLIFLYIPPPKDFFPAAPGRLARLKSANLLLLLFDTRHSSSSTIIMFTIIWVSLPSRSWRPQQPGRPAAAATATAAVALQASGASPP